MAVLSVQFINVNFFSLGKAAQGFAARRTLRTPQPEIRYDRQAGGKKANYEWNLGNRLSAIHFSTVTVRLRRVTVIFRVRQVKATPRRCKGCRKPCGSHRRILV